MGNKLYVGNLSYSVGDEDLRAHFESYGAVKDAKVIIDRDTNRSKGFGFVTFESADSAQEAISGANGSDFNGRNIKVSEAEERPPRNGGGRDNSRGHSNNRGNARY